MRKLGGSGKRQIKSLQGNGTFKFYVTLDHHNPGLKLNYCLLPVPPNYSLPSTFVVCVRGQLDLELTLRDQRMVSDLSHVPRRTKLALRCLTYF
jgi:hypothetical protein